MSPAVLSLVSSTGESSQVSSVLLLVSFHQRSSHGRLSLLGGGWLHGVPDEKGEMSGQEMMYVYPDLTVLYCTVLYCTVLYVYPDLTTLLWDTFTRGVMVGAVPGTVADMDWTGVVPRVTLITRSRNLSGC